MLRPKMGSGSQRNCFRENTLSQVRRKGLLGDHIDRAMDEILQILLESHKIQKRAPFPKSHEKVEVAILPAFAPGERTKNTHVPGSVA